MIWRGVLNSAVATRFTGVMAAARLMLTANCLASVTQASENALGVTWSGVRQLGR